MSDLAELQKQYDTAVDQRDQAYWRFTRCKRGNPEETMRLSQVVATLRDKLQAAKLESYAK